jgi:hypothetical protein
VAVSTGVVGRPRPLCVVKEIVVGVVWWLLEAKDDEFAKLGSETKDDDTVMPFAVVPAVPAPIASNDDCNEDGDGDDEVEEAAAAAAAYCCCCCKKNSLLFSRTRGTDEWSDRVMVGVVVVEEAFSLLGVAGGVVL